MTGHYRTLALGSVLLDGRAEVLRLPSTPPRAGLATDARGEVYCVGQIDTGDEFVDQTILYRDHYVRTLVGWRFASRAHLLWFEQKREHHPMRQPPANWPMWQNGRGLLTDEPDRARDLDEGATR